MKVTNARGNVFYLSRRVCPIFHPVRIEKLEKLEKNEPLVAVFDVILHRFLSEDIDSLKLS